jgi:NTE family protein
MTDILRRTLLVAACCVLAGCAYPPRNDVATMESKNHEYTWKSLPTDSLPRTLVIVTASGGGTRATALAMAVLQTLDHVKLPSGKSLADEVDVISSVSGGSVAAAYFAMHGADGLQELEQSFVRQDGMSAILMRGLNPYGLATLATPSRERIDLLIDYLDRQLFHELTFGYLVQNKRRPYLILNAADMVEGVPFPFTQYSMDLLCSDLATMKISTAVAASAAFPGALSAVTLANYSPCDVVKKPGWVDLAATGSWYNNPSRVTAGRVALAYADGSKKFVHLLDGGIADNLGVSEPFRLLTTSDESPLLFNEIQSGRIEQIVFVMVNARSFKPNRLDHDQATPGFIPMITASIDSSIDRATFGTAERIRQLLTEQLGHYAAEAEAAGQMEIATNLRKVASNTWFLPIDFDAIGKSDCRRRFHSIPTSWTLSKMQVDAVRAMGEALLSNHRDFPALLHALNATLDQDFPTIDDACGELAQDTN